MPLAFVNSGTGRDYSGPGASSLLAAATSLTAGNAIKATCRFYDPANVITVTSVTDTAGNTYVSGGVRYRIATGEVLDVWYALNATGHVSNVVSMNLSTGAQFWGVVTEQVSGVALTSAQDASVAATGTVVPAGGASATVTTSAFSTTQADEYLSLAAQIAATGQTWTPGAGYALAGQDADHVLACFYQIVSALQGSVTADATCTFTGSPPLSATMFAFKASGGGGSPVSRAWSSLPMLGVM